MKDTEDIFDNQMDWLETFWLIRIVPAERYQVEMLLTRELPERYPEYGLTDFIDLISWVASRKGREFVQHPFTYSMLKTALIEAVKRKQTVAKRLRTLERQRLRHEAEIAIEMIEEGWTHESILRTRSCHIPVAPATMRQEIYRQELSN